MIDLLLIVIILTVPAIAHFKIIKTFNKYKMIENSKDLTGQEVARKILDKASLNDIYVTETKGELTDHYDPRRKVVRLSVPIFSKNTIASTAIAAHECGHALQDKEGYFYLKLRSLIFPIVNIATTFSYIIIVIGFAAALLNLIYFGLALTLFGLLFQIITLPVEFDASKRALEELKNNNLIKPDEQDDVKEMLNAAAMTYVAGVLASALQILRLVLLAKGND